MASAREGSPVLRLSGIVVRYGQRVVLDLPELAVAPGEVLAVMGPNGAGKSTLLHVAALLRWPEMGEIWIGGERATRRTARALRRRTALVQQEPLLFAVSVLTNAASGLCFRGIGKSEAERRARVWLERFGVAHLAARKAHTLSGGEAQRTSLARAFAVEPQLLFLDEPFSALDPATRAALLPELAARLREAETAAVIVTHDAAEALALADRVIILAEGRVTRCDRPDVVLAAMPLLTVAADQRDGFRSHS